MSVTAGSTPMWINKAKDDADIIYSGSETMMSDFVDAMDDQLNPDAPEPLYLRPMAILVRPGNPMHVRRFTGLFRPGVKILVVSGAEQNGVWEDLAGATRKRCASESISRQHLRLCEKQCRGEKTWTDHLEINVWLIWNIWQVANPSLADIVPIEPPYAIYRDAGVTITRRGAEQSASRQFVDFLGSKEGAAILQEVGLENSTLSPIRVTSHRRRVPDNQGDGSMANRENRRAALRTFGLAAGTALLAAGAPATNPDRLPVDALAAELTNHVIPEAIVTPGAVGTLPELQQAGFHYAA